MLHRHDVSDEIWEKIGKNLPESKGYTGRNGVDSRKFINAVFWVSRTGESWRDLPKEYGDWKNTHRRFTRWRDKGVWEKILKLVMDEPDLSSIMTEATFVKCHMGRNWCKRWKSRYGGLKRRLNTKVRVAVDASRLPLKILVSGGNVNDGRKAEELM